MSSNLKVNTILPSAGSNIGLGTNGGNLNVDGGCKVQVGTALTLGHTVGVQFATQNLHSAGFEVNNINASGIITATSFVGSGANLTNLPSQLTLSNNADNRVITGGSGTNLVGESNLTFDGSTFTVSSGTSGDCKLIIEADTDNNNESDNATLVFKQDGGLEVSSIGHGLLSGDQNGLVLANSCSNGYISFATGSTNGHTNATERLRITADGKLIKYGTNINLNSAYIDFSGSISTPSTAAAIFRPADNTLAFSTANVERLRITSNGQVRIADANQGLRMGVDAANYKISRDSTGGDAGLLKFYGNQSGYTGYIFTGVNGERLRIDSSGNVTKPSHCVFQAVVNGSHVAAGSYVVFGSVDVNKGNDYDSSNGIFTAPVAGTYFFTISSIAFNNVSTVFRFYLRINNGNTGSGSDAHLRLDMNNDDTDYAPNASYTYYKYLNENDTARVYFIPDDNSASAYGGSDYFKFSGHLVG